MNIEIVPTVFRQK